MDEPIQFTYLDKIIEWTIVQTKGKIPFATTFIDKDWDGHKMYNYKHKKLLELDEEYSYEVSLLDSEQHFNRYIELKTVEHVLWKRKNLKESSLCL